MQIKYLLGITSACFASGSLLFADTTVTTFGSLPGATFGGTGIPNDAVEVTTYTTGNNTITLGLAASQRYANPALGNNGAGTYYATPGANYGNPANPASTTYSTKLGSTWNFDYYVNISGGNFGQYTFRLLYDFTPGVGTPDSQLGVVNLNNLPGVTSSTTLLQDSENPDFSFLGTSVPGVITPPSGGSTTFDPNATGEYTFKLQVLNQDGGVTAESDINVDVAPVPDAASTFALLSLALGGMFLFRSKLNRASAAC